MISVSLRGKKLLVYLSRFSDHKLMLSHFAIPLIFYPTLHLKVEGPTKKGEGGESSEDRDGLC